MTTGRRPTIPPDELDDTADESPRRAVTDAEARAAMDRAYYDTDPPRFADLDGRVAALERGVARRSLLRRIGEWTLSFVAGSAAVGSAWVLTKAEERGDAKRSATTMKAEHDQMMRDVQELKLHDAERKGQLDMITDRLRYPMQGPPTEPRNP